MTKEMQINHSELTSRGLPPKLKTEGIIFMPEPGGGEGFSITPEGPRPGIVEGAIITRRPQDIRHEEAKEAATQFIEAIKERPLKDWTVEELKIEFLKQGVLAAKASTERKEGWERVGDQLQPFGMSVINEAQTRGTDVNGWFLELVDTANNAGYSIRSIGADTNETEEPIRRRSTNGQEQANQHSFANGLINPDEYSVEARNVVDNINRDYVAGLLDMDSLTVQLRQAVEQGQIEPNDSRRIINEVKQDFYRQQAQAHEGDRERIGFYLLRSDEDQLTEDPFIWLDDQFDILYNIARQGQELSSPFLNSLQQLFSDASRFVQKHKRDMAEEFNAQYSTRFGQLAMRATIGYRGIDGARERSQSLLAHGFFNGFSLEDGVATSMFNRLNELMEDKRLKQGITMHVTPEIANTLQETVIREQIKLAKKGIGLFKLRIKNEQGVREEVRASDILSMQRGEDVDDVTEMLLNKTQITREINKQAQEQIEAVISGIVRTVRTAYDLSVNSQRQAVIVARGWELRNDEAYWSDPASGILNVYNAEGLLFNKFDLYNPTQWELVRRIKLDMAENEDSDNYGRPGMSEIAKEDLGTRLFRDLFTVPDFFTSGWRIKGVMDSIETRMKAAYGEKTVKEIDPRRLEGITDDQRKAIIEEAGARGEALGSLRTRDFGLFLQLKNSILEKELKGNTQAEKDADLTKKQAIYKDLRANVWGKIARFRPEEVMRLYRERSPGNPDLIVRLNAGFADSVFGEIRGVTSHETYDKFKDKYGSVIRMVREKGFRELRQINIGSTGEDGLSEGDKEIIAKYFDGDVAEVEKLQKMYAKMSEFANSSIKELMSHDRFEDIYSRTIAVDDGLLDKLESNKFWYLKDKYDQGADGQMRLARDSEGNIIQDRIIVRKDGRDAFLPISQLFAADQGGDAYVRIWNDTGNAITGMKSLVEFIHSDVNDLQTRYKAAEKFADDVSQYNGHDNRAKIIRYTVGTDLILRKIPMVADALGIAKLPFRMRMTELEKIYGPHAKNMSRDELRKMIDEYGSKLMKNMSKLDYEQEDKIRELRETKGDEAAEREKAKYITANYKKAEKYKNRLVHLTETGTGKMVERRALTLVAMIILTALSETLEVTGIKDIK